MKMLTNIALSMSLVFSANVLADEVVMSTGVKGGKYDGSYGANISKYLKSKGHTIVINQSAGSEENLSRLEKGEAQLSFATMDAYFSYLKKGGTPLEILSNTGNECAYMVTLKDGGLSSSSDLRSTKDVKVAIGNSGSGSVVMWNYLTQLEPTYKNASVVLTGGTLALNALGTPNGPIAFLFVTSKNNVNHKLVQAVNSNKNLKFVNVNDWSLNDKLPNGKAVYFKDSNKVCSGMFGCSVDTICTEGSIFYTEKLSKSILEDLSDIIAMSKSTIISE